MGRTLGVEQVPHEWQQAGVMQTQRGALLSILCWCRVSIASVSSPVMCRKLCFLAYCSIFQCDEIGDKG